jgi:hypothetical protein
LHCDDAILSASIMFLGLGQNYSETGDVSELLQCLAYRVIATRAYDQEVNATTSCARLYFLNLPMAWDYTLRFFNHVNE